MAVIFQSIFLIRNASKTTKKRQLETSSFNQPKIYSVNSEYGDKTPCLSLEIVQPHLPNKVFPDGILEIARISHNWSLNWSLISGQCLRSQDLIQQELSSWPPWTKAVALFSSPTCFSFPSVGKDRKYPQALQMREYGPPHGYCKTTVVLLASFAENRIHCKYYIYPISSIN